MVEAARDRSKCGEKKGPTHLPEEWDTNVQGISVKLPFTVTTHRSILLRYPLRKKQKPNNIYRRYAQRDESHKSPNIPVERALSIAPRNFPSFCANSKTTTQDTGGQNKNRRRSRLASNRAQEGAAHDLLRRPHAPLPAPVHQSMRRPQSEERDLEKKNTHARRNIRRQKKGANVYAVDTGCVLCRPWMLMLLSLSLLLKVSANFCLATRSRGLRTEALIWLVRVLLFRSSFVLDCFMFARRKQSAYSACVGGLYSTSSFSVLRWTKTNAKVYHVVPVYPRPPPKKRSLLSDLKKADTRQTSGILSWRHAHTGPGKTIHPKWQTLPHVETPRFDSSS